MSNNERFAILTICEYKNGKPVICDQQVLDLPALKDWANKALADVDNPGDRTPATVDAGRPRAGSDSSVKPKRYKADDATVLEAMTLLKERAEEPRFTDWTKKKIVEYLNKKGIKLEISKKARIGRYWAVIYEHKKGTPPRGWDKKEVKKARKEFEREHIDNFKWLL